MDKQYSWKAFVPYMDEDFLTEVSASYLTKASAEIDAFLSEKFHLGERPGLKINLLHSILFLTTAYYNEVNRGFKDKMKKAIIQCPPFVVSVVKMNCVSLAEPGYSGILESAIVLMKMLEESLTLSDDVKCLLLEQHLFEDALLCLENLQVQQLVEKNFITQLVWINFLLLYKCVRLVNLSHLQDPSQCLQSFDCCLEAPDVEIRIISKTFKAALARKLATFHTHSERCVLQSDEAKHLKAMIGSDPSEPYSFHGLSFGDFFSIIKDLVCVSGNTEQLLQYNMVPALAELSESLPEVQQNTALEVVCCLLEGGTCIFTEDTEKPSGLHDYQSLYQEEILIPKESQASLELCEKLLKYIVRVLLPMSGLPYLEIKDKVASWQTIAASISLLATLYLEMDPLSLHEAISSTLSLQGQCEALFTAFFVPVYTNTYHTLSTKITDLLTLLMIWTDASQTLAHQVAKSGLLSFPVAVLRTARLLSSWDEKYRKDVKMSFNTLFNCVSNPENIPAFRFGSIDVIPELIYYIKSNIKDFSIISKFILSYLAFYLDYHQHYSLVLDDKDVEYCLMTLSAAATSPDFSANGYSLLEVLSVFCSLTHPSLIQARSSLQVKISQSAMSEYEKEMIIATAALRANVEHLGNLKLLELLKSLLKLDNIQIVEKSSLLLWNLVQVEDIHDKVVENLPGLVEDLLNMCDHSRDDNKSIIDCILMTLDSQGNSEEPFRLLQYARTCYKVQNYQEAVTICSSILSVSQIDDDDLKNQCKLLKGKSLFYQYQKKAFYLIDKKQSLSKVEQKRLEDECFFHIKETIALLGNTLDCFVIDEEGSKLLDWAMMDCLQLTNQLNLCKRCLMCRQKTSEIRRSHMWPEFLHREVFKSQLPVESHKSKLFVFGMDKYQLKSAGECWYWMLCRKCEELISQNAESHFSKTFLHVESGEIAYSSWFFNFCCAVLFRTMVNAKFPMRFNDDEVYSAFIFCRKQLLMLPVKIGKKLIPLSPLETFQIEKFFTNKACKNLQPFFLTTPKEFSFDLGGTGSYINPSGLLSTACLATFRFSDGESVVGGHAHFFATSFQSYHIVLCFTPSSKHVPPINFQVVEGNGVYVFPEEKDKFQSITKGHWMVFHRAFITAIDVSSELAKSLSVKAAKTFRASCLSMEEFSPVTAGNSHNMDNQDYFSVSFASISNKPHINFLPVGFDITFSSLNHCISFPKKHLTILHGLAEYEDDMLTVFLNISTDQTNSFPCMQPYCVFAFSGSHGVYVDGAYVEAVDKRINFSKFLLENDFCSEQRVEVQGMIQLAAELLQIHMIGKGILNMKILFDCLKIQESVTWAAVPLDSKCSESGCWYCSNRCHYCLQEVNAWSKIDTPFTSVPFNFCSKTCLGMVCLRPEQLSKCIFVNDHLKDSQLKSPAVLDIFRISRQDSSNYNTIDGIYLCLSDGSGSLAIGQPYVLWVTHEVNSYSTALHSMLITDKAEVIGQLPIQFLECMSAEFLGSYRSLILQVNSSYSNYQPALQQILNLAMEALKYQSIQSYISLCQARKEFH